MKKLLFLAAMTTAIAGFAQTAETARINGQLSPRQNNATVLLISLSQGDTIATTKVNDGAFQVELPATEVDLVSVRVGGRALGNVIVEPGDIIISQEAVVGTPLNEMLDDYNKFQAGLYEEYSKLTEQGPVSDEVTMNFANRLKTYSDSMMMSNIDNPVGASILLDSSYEMELPELQVLLAQHPSLTKYSKLNKIVDLKTRSTETAVGKHYKDFAVDYDGITTRLSDIMTPGNYTLVDFWASWCGPCRREIPVIKEILEEYGPQGLDVIGVAVWDEPENTKQAMEELEISWPVMINAQSGPTDLYGILGIPSILLISPEGIILSRDQQDEDLKADVANAMSKK